MTTTIEPPTELLGAVVEQVWTSMLDRPPVDWSGPWPQHDTGTQADITIEGDWTGRLELWSSTAAATGLTQVLLGLEPETEPEAADVADALGEVVNVVAGGLKAAMGGTSVLGLPRVTGPAATSPISDQAVHLALAWHDAPLLITVHPGHAGGSVPPHQEAPS